MTKATTSMKPPQVGKVPEKNPVEDMIEVRLNKVSRKVGSSAAPVVRTRQSQTDSTA